MREFSEYYQMTKNKKYMLKRSEKVQNNETAAMLVFSNQSFGS